MNKSVFLTAFIVTVFSYASDPSIHDGSEALESAPKRVIADEESSARNISSEIPSNEKVSTHELIQSFEKITSSVQNMSPTAEKAKVD